MADFPTAAVERLGDYNGARYDAQTNPYGMAIGGHRINFPASLNDTAVVVNYFGEAATEIAAFAQQTAADRVQTGQDRVAAAASAAAAATFDPALFARLVGATFTGLVSFFVGTAARAGLNLGQRAADPTGFVDGDVWVRATGAKIRRNGMTAHLFDTDNAGPIGAFRNKLMNANGDINQRAYASNTATTAANQYTIDRWRVVVSGQRLIWTTSAAGIRTFTAPAGGVEQVIEAVNVEAGAYTLSWTGAATATVNGAAVANGAQVALNGQANVTVRFSNGTFSLPQLERALFATAPERRPIGVELALCQRYFWRGLAGAAFNQFTTAAGQNASWHVSFPVTLRTAPTLSASGVTPVGYGGFNWSFPTPDGARLLATNASGPDGASNVTVAANGYFQADAEL